MKRSSKTAESIAHIVVRAALDAYRAATLTTIDAASRDGRCERDIMDDLVAAEPTVENVQPYGVMLGPLLVSRDATGELISVDYLPEADADPNRARERWRREGIQMMSEERVRGLLVLDTPIALRGVAPDGADAYEARTPIGLVQCVSTDEPSHFRRWRARWWPVEGQPGIDLAHGPTPEDALRGADKRLRQIREAVR